MVSILGIQNLSLLINFPSVSKELSVPCSEILRRFSILSFLLLSSTNCTEFLLFSNLLCKEHALRMLNFALISFLLFSTHFSCK